MTERDWILPTSPTAPTIRRIAVVVAAECGTTVDAMTGKGRTRDQARPRQVAMVLARRLTKRSLPEIGQFFRRDHTTVCHAINAIAAIEARNPEAKAEISRIERLLQVSHLTIAPQTSEIAPLAAEEVLPATPPAPSDPRPPEGKFAGGVDPR